MTFTDFILGWVALFAYLVAPLAVIFIVVMVGLGALVWIGNGILNRDVKRLMLGIPAIILVISIGWISIRLFAPTGGQKPTLVVSNPKVQTTHTPSRVFVVRSYGDAGNLVSTDGPTIYVQEDRKNPLAGYKKVIFNNSNECRKIYASPDVKRSISCYKLDRNIIYSIPSRHFLIEMNRTSHPETLDTKFYFVSYGERELIASIHAKAPHGGHPLWPKSLSIYGEHGLLTRQTAGSLMDMIEVRTGA